MFSLDLCNEFVNSSLEAGVVYFCSLEFSMKMIIQNFKAYSNMNEKHINKFI
jgi:hypothetical protein